jgi:hypothetical protein
VLVALQATIETVATASGARRVAARRRGTKEADMMISSKTW